MGKDVDRLSSPCNYRHFGDLSSADRWDAVVFTLPAAFVGAFWSWSKRESGSLWPAVVTHLAADAAILAAGRSVIPGT